MNIRFHLNVISYRLYVKNLSLSYIILCKDMNKYLSKTLQPKYTPCGSKITNLGYYYKPSGDYMPH